MMMEPPLPGRAEEARALGRLVWFGILQLVGLIGGWIGWVYFLTSGFTNGFSSLGPNPTGAQISAAMAPILSQVEYLVIPGIILGFVAILLLYLALRDLARVDRSKFGTPSTLMIIDIVGLALVAIGLVPLLANIPSLFAHIPTGSGTPSAAFYSSVGSVIAYVILIGIGGILVLVGTIGGAILGLWRVGTKYDQTILKIGAVFLILPLLNIVAPILILVGAWEAKRHLPSM